MTSPAKITAWVLSVLSCAAQPVAAISAEIVCWDRNGGKDYNAKLAETASKATTEPKPNAQTAPPAGTSERPKSDKTTRALSENEKTALPATASGKLLYQKPNGLATASGVLIGENAVLTSAHVLVDKDGMAVGPVTFDRHTGSALKSVDAQNQFYLKRGGYLKSWHQHAGEDPSSDNAASDYAVLILDKEKNYKSTTINVIANFQDEAISIVSNIKSSMSDKYEDYELKKFEALVGAIKTVNSTSYRVPSPDFPGGASGGGWFNSKNELIGIISYTTYSKADGWVTYGPILTKTKVQDLIDKTLKQCAQ